MRELQFSDVFKMARIIRKLGIKEQLMGLKWDAATDSRQVGLQMAAILIENLDKAEKDVLEFIADLAEEKVEDVRRWSLKRLAEFFAELGKMEGLADFFQLAAVNAEEK